MRARAIWIKGEIAKIHWHCCWDCPYGIFFWTHLRVRTTFAARLLTLTVRRYVDVSLRAELRIMCLIHKSPYNAWYFEE